MGGFRSSIEWPVSEVGGGWAISGNADPIETPPRELAGVSLPA